MARERRKGLPPVAGSSKSVSYTHLTLPTTLPTLDELLAGGLNTDEAVRRLLELSRKPPRDGHVYTLRALLEGWAGLGQQPVSLREYAAGLDLAHLPRCVVTDEVMSGMRSAVSTQGKEFLANFSPP